MVFCRVRINDKQMNSDVEKAQAKTCSIYNKYTH